MLNRCLALLLLIASVPLAMGEDSAFPLGGNAASVSYDPGTSPLLVPSSAGLSAPSTAPAAEAANTTPPSTGATESENTEGPSFSLPGGYGNAPQTVTPGSGLYARPPISFSATIQQGYDDNIYSSSGERGKPFVIPEHYETVVVGPFSYQVKVPRQVIKAAEPNPVKGSLISQLSIGADILLSASRSVLSLNVNGGGLYYWDREGDPFDPSGSISLLFAYKLTPRMQFSSQISGGYYTQPNLSLINAPTQEGAGNYFNITTKSDLTYQWGARTSTDTTVGINTQIYESSISEGGNYLETTLGQSFRYALTPRLTSVIDLRAAQIRYNDTLRDSSTQFLLGGVDFLFSRRFTGSVRVGETFRQFELEGAPSATSPFLESNLSYGYGKASVLQWTNRFGFEESNTADQRNKSYRSGLNVTQVFTPKLSASVGLNYTHSMYSNVDGSLSYNQDTVYASFGLQFMATRTLTLFGNLTRSQILAEESINSYSRDQVFLGATYHF